jgi:hypothetical protein
MIEIINGKRTVIIIGKKINSQFDANQNHGGCYAENDFGNFIGYGFISALFCTTENVRL